jgi:hypothetical protein
MPGPWPPCPATPCGSCSLGDVGLGRRVRPNPADCSDSAVADRPEFGGRRVDRTPCIVHPHDYRYQDMLGRLRRGADDPDVLLRGRGWSGAADKSFPKPARPVKLRRREPPPVLAIKVGHPGRHKTDQHSERKRRDEIHPDKLRERLAGEEERRRARNRSDHNAPRHPGRPEHRERVDSGPQTPCNCSAVKT